MFRWWQRRTVPDNRIYAWRGDPRFQADETEVTAFTPVEISDVDSQDAPAPLEPDQAPSRIEITLENGRKLSVSDGVDAGFVLELARGLAA